MVDTHVERMKYNFIIIYETKDVKVKRQIQCADTTRYGAVIEERDAYMARTLWAAATGSAAVSPAFVADTTPDGQTIFRYAMPNDGPGA